MMRQRFSIFAMFCDLGAITINEISCEIGESLFCWVSNQVVDLTKLDELVNLRIYFR